MKWLNKFLGWNINKVYSELILKDICFQKFEPIPSFAEEEFLPIILIRDNQVVEVIESFNSKKEIQDKIMIADNILLVDELEEENKLHYNKIKNLTPSKPGAFEIFIAVVSYRDPDLRNTLIDLFQKASHPNDIRVYCLDQRFKEDDFNITQDDEIFDEYCIDFDFVESESSKGVCWARKYAQSRYKGENYFLQIDSHMRFASNWDDLMIKELKKSKDKKGIISCYPPHFNPKDDKNLIPSIVYTKAAKFADNGSLIMNGGNLEDVSTGKELFNHGWISAGFYFTYGKFLKEVNYDPYLYFQGEETDISIKAFSKGWNSYAPSTCLIWHYYFHIDESKRIRHWDEPNNWGELTRSSNVRMKHKLGLEKVDKSRNELINIDASEVFHLDKIVKFEKLLGVNFQNRIVY